MPAQQTGYILQGKGGGQSSANIHLNGEVAYVLLKLLQLAHSPGLPGLVPAQQTNYILQGKGGGHSSANINLNGEVANVLLKLLQLAHSPGPARPRAGSTEQLYPTGEGAVNHQLT